MTLGSPPAGMQLGTKRTVLLGWAAAEGSLIWSSTR